MSQEPPTPEPTPEPRKPNPHFLKRLYDDGFQYIPADQVEENARRIRKLKEQERIERAARQAARAERQQQQPPPPPPPQEE